MDQYVDQEKLRRELESTRLKAEADLLVTLEAVTREEEKNV